MHMLRRHTTCSILVGLLHKSLLPVNIVIKYEKSMYENTSLVYQEEDAIYIF